MIRPFYDEKSEKVSYACNIGTYKMRDDFGTMLGFRSHITNYTATIIYDPKGEVIIPFGSTLEGACRYLRHLR